MLVGSIDFDTDLRRAPALAGKTINFFGWHADALTLICLLLFMGAMGKSAQFLLHTWLPDAMEGPTPVSALIHAATMVTAGVFMVARLSPLFELRRPRRRGDGRRRHHRVLRRHRRPRAERHQAHRRLFDLFAARLHVRGAWGLAAYSVGMFHLFTHAFFKALLFLGSGSVIHAMHHEQDIRNMGGSARKIPLTYAMMVIGTLALTGFPLHRRAISPRTRSSSRPSSAHNRVGALRLRAARDRGRPDLVLFVAADLQDLPRRAARPPCTDEARA